MTLRWPFHVCRRCHFLRWTTDGVCEPCIVQLVREMREGKSNERREPEGPVLQ